jgi:phytanoyl-CoA dioxygenase PhyH
MERACRRNEPLCAGHTYNRRMDPPHRNAGATSRMIAGVALAPWWIAQIATKAKSFRDNPVLGSPTLNRWGLHVARRRAAARLAERRRKRLSARVTPAELEFFDRNGYFIRRQALDAEAFAALRREIETMRGSAREMRQGPALTRRIGLDDTQLAAMPATRAFVKNGDVRALIHYAASYGGEPTFVVQSIISETVPAECDPQTVFHSDTFHPTAKSWLFLVDVGAGEGPFAYVPGSHRLTEERLAWEREQSLGARDSTDQMHGEGSFRIDEAELSALGLPPPLRFAVPANTLIIADTSGFHARTPSPKRTCRVEVYATLRRTPFIPWVGGHSFALPPITGRHTLLDTALQHAIERLGIGRSPWRPVGPVGAFDIPPDR